MCKAAYAAYTCDTATHFHKNIQVTTTLLGFLTLHQKSPSAADHLLDVATEQINSLSDMPHKFRFVDDPVLSSWGIRFVIVNNYLAFYTIDEEKQMVIVVRFLLQKSNWNAILRRGFSLI